MKFIFLSMFFLSILYADTTKVCFYTIENNIEDFKSFKKNFDKYLEDFGDYEFQAFSDKESFDNYINNNDAIFILSSRHYKNLSKTKKIKANLIAKKNNKIKDLKVLIGKRDKNIKGVVTSAYTKKYTEKLLGMVKIKSALSVLVVPKEIDALMSVGFGMSDFAIVSKDSFTHLQDINGFLTRDLITYKELHSSYRMVVASKIKNTKNKDIDDIFKNMDKNIHGKLVLNALAIDKFIVLDSKDLSNLRGIE